MTKKLRMIEAFAGIGSQIAAMKRLGVDVENVGISEIDKYAVQSYEAINGKVNNYGDITKVEKFDPTDLLIYSSPCQDFSQAGLQRGLVDENGNQTRSGLLLEVARLLEEYQKSGEMPKYLLMENVKALVSKKFKDKFEMWLQALELFGYNNYWKVLNAKDYGIPQNRERVFVVSIRKDIDKGTFSFPDKIPLKHRLKDLLETSVDEKYYISDEKVKKFIEKRIEQNNQATDDNVIRTGNCLRPDKESGGSFAGATYNPIGLAPTLNTMEGGNRQPFVEFGDKQPTEPFCVASRGRNPENPSDRTAGSPTEQRLEANTDFVCNTLTSVQKDSYVAEPSLQFVGGVGEPTRLLDGKELSRNYKQGYRVYNTTGISPACTIDTGGSPALFTEEACVKHLGNIYQVKSHGGFNGDIFDSRHLSPTLTTMYEGSKPPYIEEVQKIGNLYHKSGQNGNIYSTDDLSPTIMSCQGVVGNGIGSNNSPKIIEENETIPTGQLSLFETYSDTKQANIGSSENQVVSDLKETMNKQDVSYCIDANYWKGSTIDNFIDKHRRQLVMDCEEPNVLTPKRTEYGKAIRKEYEAGNIQESRHNMTEMQPRTDGISNTITTVQKDNMLCEPTITDNKRDILFKVMENGNIRGFQNDEKKSSASELQFYNVNNVSGSITTANVTKIIQNEPKERFFQQAIETFEQNECDAGDTVDAFHKRINSSGCSPTLTTRPEGFKTAILPIVDDNQVIQQGAILSNYATKLEKITDVAGTLMARDYKGFGNQTTNGVIENDTAAKTPSLRIRKLTPKECWRLMGFTDEEHDAAAFAGVSASQRYKQAGNSIVVQCLCFIFWKLLQGTEYEPENGFKTDWLEELFK